MATTNASANKPIQEFEQYLPMKTSTESQMPQAATIMTSVSIFIIMSIGNDKEKSIRTQIQIGCYEEGQRNCRKWNSRI